MYSWKVGDVFGWHDAPAAGGRRQRNVTDTMWPPGTSQARDMHLERCVRIMPHLDDTGGFFIVAIDKVAELPGDVEGGAEKTSDDDASARDGKGWNESNRVAPVIPVENDALVRSMREQYGVDDAAAGLRECLMTRRAGVSDAAAPKRLYYVSGGAKKLLAADGGGAGGLQVVSAGVKAFERQAAKGAACEYRVTQEGLDVLLPHLERQVVARRPGRLRRSSRGSRDSLNRRRRQARSPAPGGRAGGVLGEGNARGDEAGDPGCVVLVTRATREEGGGDEQPAKRAKKEKKEKKGKEGQRASGQGWSGVAEPGDLAVACWFGEGEKGKSLSVLASKAEGGHLLHQLRSSSTKRDENLASLRWARSRAPRRVHTVDYAYPTKCSCAVS